MICDLAETYHVYDYRGLSVRTLATLVVGLRDDSRTKLKLAGMPVDTNTLMLAAMVDHLAFLAWAQTENGAKGVNRPQSVVNSLLHAQEQRKTDCLSFDTADEFEKMRNRILGKE